MDYKELGLTKEELVEMYRMMRLIRVFEESAVAYFKQGIVIGNMHMYVGEEVSPFPTSHTPFHSQV